MDILEAAIHVIEKSSGDRVVNLEPRPTKLIQIDDKLNKLATDILKIYGKSTLNYGTFDKDQGLYPFSAYIDKYLNDDAYGMMTFSTESVNQIASKMMESSPATGGYAAFIRYESQGKSWLIIAMLKLKSETGIDRKTYKLNDSISFDVNHLHEAARIDLSKLVGGKEPYLSFVKKGSRTDDVTLYFRHALGCTSYTESRFNTKQLISAVDAYCKEFATTAAKKQAIRKAVFDYCEEKRINKEPVNLEALSAYINDADPDEFHDFVRDSEYEVSQSFEPHKAEYERYQRIKGKFRGVSISFDWSEVIDENIDVNEESSSLIIKHIPEKMLLDIRRAKGLDQDLDE